MPIAEHSPWVPEAPIMIYDHDHHDHRGCPRPRHHRINPSVRSIVELQGGIGTTYPMLGVRGWKRPAVVWPQKVWLEIFLKIILAPAAFVVLSAHHCSPSLRLHLHLLIRLLHPRQPCSFVDPPQLLTLTCQVRKIFEIVTILASSTPRHLPPIWPNRSPAEDLRFHPWLLFSRLNRRKSSFRGPKYHRGRLLGAVSGRRRWLLPLSLHVRGLCSASPVVTCRTRSNPLETEPCRELVS